MATLAAGKALRRRAERWLASAALLLAALTAALAQPECPPALCLPPACQTLNERITDTITQAAPDVPLEEQPPGRTIAEQAHGTIACYQDPIDIVLQYRIPIDFAPSYLPEIEPSKNNAQLSGRELLVNWQLEQALRVNPFDEALKQVEILEHDADTRSEQLGWVAGYAFLHRNDSEVGIGVTDALLSDITYVRKDVQVSALGPLVLEHLPPKLKQFTEVTPGQGEVSVDLRVTPDFAYDSVATNEQMLVTAAERGIGALVIAGRTEIEGAQAAQRLAEELKCEGKLPPDFRVVIGQYVTSRTGDVVGVFLSDRLLEGQTMVETVKEIHRQGGLAYMPRPGEVGAPAELERLPFDGYFIQPGNFELFRTLLLLDDPRFACKSALYASGASIGFAAGLPYTNVKLDCSAADPLKAGLQQHQGYAASTLYFPWMMVLLIKPIATYQKTLNQYFQLNDWLTLKAGRAIGADNMILRTTWDNEMEDLINLFDAPSALNRLFTGGSELRQLPQVTYVAAEFGKVAVGYNRERHEWQLTSRWRW